MTVPLSDDRRLNVKIGNYRCVKLIEVMERSALYHALHQRTGRMCVVRIVDLPPHFNYLERIEAHLKDVQAMPIPNIVPITEWGIEDERLYIAMPFLGGGNLQLRLNEVTDDDHLILLPSIHDLADMVEQVAVALDMLHAHDMVHGQLEPRAIEFDHKGGAYLGDIGLTRLNKLIYELPSTNSFHITLYLPPESWEGEKPKPASDQYALACIAYELLTGRTPYSGSSIIGLMQAHQEQVAPPPHHLRPGLPLSLAYVFWQALAKPMDARFHTVGEFAHAFRLAINELPHQPNDFFTRKLF